MSNVYKYTHTHIYTQKKIKLNQERRGKKKKKETDVSSLTFLEVCGVKNFSASSLTYIHRCINRLMQLLDECWS